MSIPILLASTSPYRKQQLQQLRLKFSATPPLVDEEKLKSQWTEARAMAMGLAQAKAESLSLKHPETLIIGSDQLVHFDGEILGKAGNFERAKEQLIKMSGRTHELLTALFMCYQGRHFASLDSTEIRMKKLSAKEIEHYLHLDQAFDCAGSYKFEKAGLLLVDSMKLQDPSALIGLPLIALAKGLHELTGKNLTEWTE